MAELLLIDETGSSSTLFPCLSGHAQWQVNQLGPDDEFQKHLEQQCYDLVIANGTLSSNWLDQLRQTVELCCPNSPLLLVTCDSNHESAIRSLQLGASSFMPADAHPAQLQQVITRILALTQYRRDVQSSLSHCRSCRFQFQLDNQTDLVHGVVNYLREVLDFVTGAPVREQIRIAIAVEEAVQNAIVHGNLEVSSTLRDEPDDRFYQLVEQRAGQLPYSARRVAMDVQIRTDLFEVSITDEGPGFDFEDLQDPRTPQHRERPHGRGLLLIRTFMDSVQYDPPGNRVTLTKRLSTAAPASRNSST